MPQAQQAAAALGVPALANVFYYGKDFGSQQQRLTKEGKLVQERYKPLSVTKAGALGEMLEEQEIAEQAENGENVNDYTNALLAQSETGMSLDDLLNIIQRG
jgi:hypothetical protein